MCRGMLGQGPEGLEQARLRLCLCQLLREQGQREAAEQEADAAIWLLGLEERAGAGLRAQALYEKGLLRWLAGDGAGATPLVRQALSRCRTLEAPPEVPELPALCTVLLARIARAGGRYDRAARQLREALQEALPGVQAGAQAGVRALLWQNLALVESERGRREVAVAAAEAAICEASRPEAAEAGWRTEPLRELLVRLLGG